ncbi:hypothetical protein F8171_03795, partial [Bacillus cereus]
MLPLLSARSLRVVFTDKATSSSLFFIGTTTPLFSTNLISPLAILSAFGLLSCLGTSTGFEVTFLSSTTTYLASGTTSCLGIKKFGFVVGFSIGFSGILLP